MNPNSYRVWAPNATRVTLVRAGSADVTMQAGEGGWFFAPGITPSPGKRYGFKLDDSAIPFPDPRSVSQPGGVHDLSEVIDNDALEHCPEWTGMDMRSKVIYELHIGTFTAEPEGTGGTCDSAIERLDELVDLGIDAIEIMPVAAFPGKRGWGYDGGVGGL